MLVTESENLNVSCDCTNPDGLLLEQLPKLCKENSSPRLCTNLTHLILFEVPLRC